ncbi:MAG: tetratricopeptide repeat protein [Planctomycetota bacterium]
MHRRTRRRLIVLAVIAAAGGAVGAGGYVALNMQRARIAERSLADGMAAYRDKDYTNAVRQLGTHYRYDKQNVEALLAFADARRRVPAPNGAHLTTAVAIAQRALVLDPGNAEARRTLLELYAEMGFNSELVEVAGEMLAEDPADEQAARLRIAALLSMGRDAPALDAARQLRDARGGDIDGHESVIIVMNQTGASTGELRTYLQQEVAPEHAGTAGFAVLAAGIESDGGSPGNAGAILREAAESQPESGAAAATLLDAIEHIAAIRRDFELYQFSEERLSAWLEDPELAGGLYETAAGRAWRRGDASAAHELVMVAQANGNPTPGVLGWGALAAIDLQLDASAVRELLGNADTPEAAYWRRLVDAYALATDGPEARSLLPEGAELVNARGSGSAAMFHIAQLDAAAGRMARAIARLEVLQTQPGWRRARLVLARAYLAQQQPGRALSLFSLDPELLGLAGADAIFGDALASAVEASPDPSQFDPSLLEQELQQAPDSAVVLAASARVALAQGEIARGTDLIARLLEADPRGAAVSIVRLAQPLRTIDGSLADRLIEHVAGNADSPQDVQAAAFDYVLRGRAADARALIDRVAALGLEADPIEWALVRLRIADLAGTPEDLARIAALSERHAGSPRVQLAVLEGANTWTDPALIAEAIRRLEDADGPAQTEALVFSARLQLDQDDSPEAAEAVAGLLAPYTGTPAGKRDTNAMLLAAEAFERMGEPARAVEALAFAADGDDPARALPVLIERLQARGAREEAGRRLQQFLALGALAEPSRRALIGLLGRQGMVDEARALAAELASSGQTRDILAAGIVTRPASGGAPLSGAEEAAVAAAATPGETLLAARLLARVERQEDCLRLVATLPEQSEAGQRALIAADFLERFGRTDEAIQTLVAHARSDGGVEAWVRAGLLLVGNGRQDEARTMLSEARTALPDEASIGELLAALEPATTPTRRLSLFTAAAGRQDAAARGIGELGAICERYNANEIDLAGFADALASLTNRRGDVYLAWRLLVQARLELEQFQAAAGAARRAAAALPGDPRPAGQAALLFYQIGSPDDAVTMARQWKERASGDADQLQADIIIAGSRLTAGQPAEAIALLGPRRATLEARPDVYTRGLLVLAEAHASVGDIAVTDAIMRPLAEGEPWWANRLVSMAPLALPASAATPVDADRAGVALGWLRDFGPAVAEDAAGALVLASAWLQFVGRAAGDEPEDRIGSLLSEVRGTSRESWQLNTLVAQLRTDQGRYEEALERYEAALGLADPPPPVLLNNIADLLSAHLGQHERAIGFARRAVEAIGDQSGLRQPLYDTLGEAFLRSGQADRALETFETALAFDSGAPGLRLGRARALAALGRNAEAEAELRPLLGRSDLSADEQSAAGRLADELGMR